MSDDRYVLLDLDKRGRLLHGAEPVEAEAVPRVLRRRIAVPEDVTDIVVFVHGWMTPQERADRNARRLFGSIRDRLTEAPGRYPRLRRYKACNIAIRWPSRGGYAGIRDRAHAMTTEGQAAQVIAHLLGYLNAERRPPDGRPNLLGTAGGQYLHCVGHSFGGRFLCHAVQEAAHPPTARKLGWPWRNDRYPFTIDSLLVFQMAAPDRAFEQLFPRLLSGDAPVNCPIVLTHSAADRATGSLHRIAEKANGIGNGGATAPAGHITDIELLPLTDDYRRADFPSRIVNVDAGRLYRRGRGLPGAHSDFWYPESMHLLLSLFSLAR